MNYRDRFKIIFRRRLPLQAGWGVFLSILVILATFFIGLYVGKKIESAKGTAAELKKIVNKEVQPDFLVSKEVDFGIFWQVWNKIKEDYVSQPVDEIKMFYGALSGLAASLEDPYSVFLKPETAKEFQQELSGKFEGIGAEIGIRDETLVIIAPLADSPAERAGLLPGDKILKIDELDTAGIALDHAVRLIRGPKGTKVKLLVSRSTWKEPREIEILRASIVVKSVQWRMIDDLAYIKILQFGMETDRDFENAVKKIVLKNPRGIILDLRNNPGGFLDSAVRLAGEWVPDKVVVYERYKNEDRGLKASGRGRLADFKTIVLINRGSASGSEIVSGALKDYNQAILVGETTFGKGSVQDYREFKDGSALKMTIALWLTPNGASINNQGIEPNIKVELTEEDVKAGRDPQLEKAKELLK